MKQADIIAKALDACSKRDCRHCLYQGKGIRCADRLKLDAANLIKNMKLQALLKEDTQA